mmetsp:Transcript_114908/g.246941  ORF Transcript_114908/g.246941 Transcript_114908/m.246941 type:complete len:197 (-) Transcript_114908:391-981(-)
METAEGIGSAGGLPRSGWGRSGTGDGGEVADAKEAIAATGAGSLGSPLPHPASNQRSWSSPMSFSDPAATPVPEGLALKVTLLIGVAAAKQSVPLQMLLRLLLRLHAPRPLVRKRGVRLTAVPCQAHKTFSALKRQSPRRCASSVACRNVRVTASAAACPRQLRRLSRSRLNGSARSNSRLWRAVLRWRDARATAT